MSTDELRTAAIEAIRSDIADLLGDDCTEFGLVSWAEGIVDAVLPLLVAGTASRIADAIEAETVKHRRCTVNDANAAAVVHHEGLTDGLTRAAAIARRVGETS